MILGIVVYQSIPLLWFVLLWRVRHELNPRGQSLPSALLLREGSKILKPYQFLVSDYKPSRWGYEVFEMYRRLFFVAVLPLLGEGSARALIGVFASVWAALIARESWPFIRSTTCVLLVVGNLQILFVFFAATLLITESLDGFGLSDFELGVILFAVNLLSFIRVSFWGYGIYREEKRREARLEANVKKIEWACNFSDGKFGTTFDAVQHTKVPPSHCLAFFYASLAQISRVLRSGISVEAGALSVEAGGEHSGGEEEGGVLVTISPPHQLSEAEKAAFPSREAFVALCLPKTALSASSLAANDTSWVVPAALLEAMRSPNDGDPSTADPASKKASLLPHLLLRAFQLDEHASSAEEVRRATNTQRVRERHSSWLPMARRLTSRPTDDPSSGGSSGDVESAPASTTRKSRKTTMEAAWHASGDAGTSAWMREGSCWRSFASALSLTGSSKPSRRKRLVVRARSARPETSDGFGGVARRARCSSWCCCAV